MTTWDQYLRELRELNERINKQTPDNAGSAERGASNADRDLFE